MFAAAPNWQAFAATATRKQLLDATGCTDKNHGAHVRVREVLPASPCLNWLTASSDSYVDVRICMPRRLHKHCRDIPCTQGLLTVAKSTEHARPISKQSVCPRCLRAPHHCDCGRWRDVSSGGNHFARPTIAAAKRCVWCEIYGWPCADCRPKRPSAQHLSTPPSEPDAAGPYQRGVATAAVDPVTRVRIPPLSVSRARRQWYWHTGFDSSPMRQLFLEPSLVPRRRRPPSLAALL